jgi:ornithine--oxo-acid transaminase
MVIGKALSGGFYPVSATLADKPSWACLRRGSMGPRSAGIRLGQRWHAPRCRVIREEKLAERAERLGTYFMEQLAEIPSPHVKEVRGKGLLIGVELKPEAQGARRFCEALQERGILAKETHQHVIRFAPPLVIDKETIDWALPRIEKTEHALKVFKFSELQKEAEKGVGAYAPTYTFLPSLLRQA